MTIINAIKEMKRNGVVALVGFGGEGRNNIEKYLAHNERIHDLAIKYAAEVKSWKYTLDHEDEYELANIDGHWCIICTHGCAENMAVYGDFDSQEEMDEAVNAYIIRRQAEAIAARKIAEGSSMPYEAWIAVVVSELTKAHENAHMAFVREYCNGI